VPRTARPPVVHKTHPLLDNIVTQAWTSAKEDLRKNLNPYALDATANTAGLSLREHAARSAQSFARAEKALEGGP